MMRTTTWVRRLTDELPGWHAWYSGTPGRGWYAVPTSSGTGHAAALELPYRIGPYRTPQALREAARERYADGDTCQTCGDDWRICGHRQPEARLAP